MSLSAKSKKIIAGVLISLTVALGGLLVYIWYFLPQDAGPPTKVTPPPTPVAVVDAPKETVAPPALTVTAEKDTAAGVETDSGFIIRSSRAISADAIAPKLSVTPAVEYTLTQRSANELYVRTLGALEAETVYNIRVAENSYEPPQSWAFQTKNSFRVTGAFPADKGRYVPVDSGIELYFSQAVGDISRLVTITPALAGRFSPFDNKTIVFIPTERMAYDTTYTVTLAADIRGVSGDTLPEDYTFSFRTESGPDKYNYPLYPYDGLAETFTCADPIMIKLYAYVEYADHEVNVEIYRYPNPDAYMEALKRGDQEDSVSLPTDALERIAAYSDRLLMNRDVYWNTAFLPLRENPGPGWYLVDIRTPPGNTGTSGKRAQKLMQITDITVYTQAFKNQMLFWLNDAENGQPIAGARVRVEGREALSDRDGLALISIPSSETDADSSSYSNKEIRIQHDGRQFGGYLPFIRESETPLEKLYYSYVYTDRAVYQPDDTVRFWGVIMPRASGARRPESVTLDWSEGGVYPDGLTFDVLANGTFQGELKLEKHISGWERVPVNLGGKELTSMSFTVMEYVKPVYTADISLDKTYYRKNDKITALASANFYDGTPAAGLSLSLSAYQYSAGTQSKQVTTDQNGRGKAVFSIEKSSSWMPLYYSIDGYTSGAEDQSVYFHQSALVFPNDYMLRSDTRETEEGFILDLWGYHIDFSKVDSGEYAKNDNDTRILRGESASMQGNATLHKVEYVKRKTGEFYDFINKVVIDRYTYDRIETVAETFPIQMEEGVFASAPFDYPKEDHVYYYFEISVSCPDGSTLRESCYPRWRNAYYNDSGQQFVRYIFKQNRAQDVNYRSSGYFDDYSYYYWYYYSGDYGLSERISMRLSDQDDRDVSRGRLLYTVMGKELLSYATTDSYTFELDFKPEYAPNAMIAGAYFDGRHVFSVSGSGIEYRADDRKLDISVSPDKERYRPGEEVVLRLQVKDQRGGGQVANYLLSVADEAAFAVMDQNANPLGGIYRSYYINYRQYASYIQPYEINYWGECGEGDSNNVRRNFVDTVAFISGQTDAAGAATLRFKLADNITSWRLTSIAFYESDVDGLNMPHAGKNVSNIESGLPFFLNQVMNEKYLAGDSVGLSLRCAGNAIKTDREVEYEAIVSDAVNDTIISEIKANDLAGNYCLIDFGALAAGRYKVLTRAKSGDYSDAVEKGIEVVDSLLLTSRYSGGDLRDGVSVSPKRFPVGIVFYDVENRLLYDILYKMLYTPGKRADQAIVRALAGRRLNQIDPENAYPDTLDVDGEELQYWRDGLRLFPYAETDPLLSAKAAAAAPELLNQSALADYFTRVLLADNHTPLDHAAAYMGLGALKKPVLLDLRRYFSETLENEDSSLEEKLYLATGLALLGDTNAASDWYTKEIHGLLTREGNTLLYRKSGAAHEDYKLTSAISMLASLINHPDHQQLLLYLTTHRSATYLPLLELAIYTSRYSPKPDSPAAFSYQLDGKTIRKTFDKSRSLYLELGKKQLAEARFEVLEGDVGYGLYYFGGFDEAEKTLPQGVSFSQDVSASSVKLGDKVLFTTVISFDGSAPVGHYHLSETVPSGFRYTGVADYQYNSDWYYRKGEGGMLDFYIFPRRGDRNASDFNEPYMPGSVTITYEARAVLPGTYIIEAPAIQYSGDNTLYAGERGQISVTK